MTNYIITGHIMDNKDIDKFLGTLYNFGNILIAYIHKNIN